MVDKVLILGAKGMLGGQLQKVFPKALAWGRSDVDVTKIEDLKFKIEKLEVRPGVIINCVAFNDVDGAEEKKDVAFLLNATVPGNLAKLTKELGIPLVHFSTNYVFDGEKGEYKEDDVPHPLSVYAKSKHQGETGVAKHGGQYYILRTAVLFGPKGESEASKKSFVDIMLDASVKTDTIKAVSDEINSITYSADLAEMVQYILMDSLPSGIYHSTNSGSASWYEFAKEIFSITGKKINLLPVPSTEFSRKAIRPKKSVLINTKLLQVRSWQEALSEFLSKNSV